MSLFKDKRYNIIVRPVEHIHIFLQITGNSGIKKNPNIKPVITNNIKLTRELQLQASD